MESLSTLYEQLGLNKDNGLFIFSDRNWEGKFSQKIEYVLDQIQPDALYCFNEEPLFLFFEYPEDEYRIHKQCWNFNRSPVIFVNTSTDLKIYNGFSFDKERSLLRKLAEEKDINQFSYKKIVSGTLWKEYENKFSKKNRLDYKLLQNIETARNILVIKQKLESSIANKLIGRLIFARYLIDRRVKIDYNKRNNGFFTDQDLLSLIRKKNELYDFFDFLNSGFNGDLFPLDDEKHHVTSENLDVLYRLFNGEEIETGQLSLFKFYDFDIIPVEFISNIYEYFMGKDKRETNKSFYTPPFLVDYILNQTIRRHLRKNRKSVSCKVLDPACGSGIFLVETLRMIILRFKELNPHIKPSQFEFKESIKNLLLENIYGIDRDRDALEIAAFSLYITLLDFFEDPKDIQGFKFPKLLGVNLIEADFFQLDHQFNDSFDVKKNKISFDFIVGNPPWGKVDSPYMDYIKSREKKENKEIKVSDKQIAQAYMVRVSDFSNNNTKCSLIITSKILYNLNADRFRKYFANNFFIDEVLEISSVRKQIFIRVVGPAAIITFRYASGKNTENNKVEHIAFKPNPLFELFNSILIEKYDCKEVKQSFFIDYDWLWKVLVYGSVLDFYFIKKLKDRKLITNTIKSIIKNGNNNLICGEGVEEKGDRNDARHLIGKPLIDTKKKDLTRFYLRYRSNSLWNRQIAHRPRNRNLFKAPMLLIKSGLEKDFRFVASISDRDTVFTKSIFAIKSATDKVILEILLGLISSNLMAYFIFMTGASTGIEREQIFDRELYPFPVIIDKKIGEKVQKLLELHQKQNEPGQNGYRLGGYESEINKVENELNQLIYELYRLSETEKDLLSYAFEISIPVLQEKENKKPFEKLIEVELEQYARLFIDHFSAFHNSDDNGYFQVEIYQTQYIVAMNFKIVTNKPNECLVWEKDSISEDIVGKLAGLAFQKVSNKLFIQKDVKGINKDSFYVIKPNQYKYWHKAIARLDIIEFENNMLKSQLDQDSYEQD